MNRAMALAGALALAIAQPATAQDGGPQAEPDFAALASAMGKMFTPEPLTAEQETRLPQAEAVVGQLFPPGTYRKMMDQMMGPMLDGIFGAMKQMPVADLARLGGVDEAALAGTGEATLGEVTAILDPAFEERNRIVGQVSIDMAARLMDRIEPGYRAGLARALAVRFSGDDLTELNRFFATPVGARYASESMLIYADPQVMAAMNEMMPAMFELMPAMMAEMEATTAHLPRPRSAADLDEEELGRLAQLLGTPAEELKARSRQSWEGAADEAR